MHHEVSGGGCVEKSDARSIERPLGVSYGAQARSVRHAPRW
jgi:hypothetical protein